ncbi:craniofacial development protein 2-like [Palaemon carinicauda]|uniref:craniofacial development protein 2-like n=1 Tax=Palaemon carinicauda TaxID=392227 RepID=UPI0035B672E4
MDKHTNGVGFLVNKNVKNSVLGCRPVSSRAISICLRAAPFNITIVQAYTPTTDQDDDAVEAFYSQLQETIDKVDKKDILIIQGDWNAKVGKDALKDWKEFCGPSCNDVSNERGLRLLEFASYNNAVLANTLGEHKASRRWTWHAPNGIHHNQIDYILVQNRFRSGIKRATTRTFPGADVGSDHDLVFVNFKLRLKTIKKPKNTRMKFNLDRLRDPNIAESFKATVGGKFAPLLTLEEDHSAETLTTQLNKVMIESANEMLGNVRGKTQRWVTDEIMDMCDKRKELKKNKTTPTGATEYREINRKIRKSINQAKEDWIGKQCTEIEEKLEKNNSRRAFQIVKDLTKPKQA